MLIAASVAENKIYAGIYSVSDEKNALFNGPNFNIIKRMVQVLSIAVGLRLSLY